MTDAISVLVTSLGDFPLEPDSGKAWLWSAAADRLLWVSSAAREELALGDATNAGQLIDPRAFHGFAEILTLPAPDREPVRVQQLSLTHAGRSHLYTCLCRHVPLITGGFGLLAVAIGAPARSMAAVSNLEPARSMPDVVPPAPAVEEKTAAPVESNEVSRIQPRPSSPLVAHRELRTLEDPVAAKERTGGEPPRASSQPVLPGQAPSIPAWTALAETLRRPLRFVWQSDESGRFVHLSRELAQAVGPANAMLMGQTWPTIVRKFGIIEAEGIDSGFASTETWTATPALWPVEGTDLGVPVEMAGMPIVEDGAFAGFRGYGIARIERSIVRPGSAAKALEADIPAITENPEDRFGPAIGRALAATTPEAAVVPAAAPPHAPEPSVGTPEPAVPAKQSAPQAPSGTTLSTIERETFREIARALGRLSDPQEATPPANALPAASQSQAASPVLPANPLPSAEAPAKLPSESRTAIRRPLDILKQSLAERGGAQFRIEPAEQARTEQGPAAPVVSFDALQARRDQKFRQDPLVGAAISIVDKLPVGLLVMQEGEVVFANRHLLDLSGFSDLESFRSEGGAETLFSQRKGGRNGSLRHFSITTRTGETLPVEASIQSISWDEAPATLTSFRRFEEAATGQQQKAVELDLLSAQAELRELQSVLDTATDGVILLDGKGRILGLNRSAEALFGFDQNEIAGENLTILLEPESHMAALDYLEGLNSNGVNSILNDGRDVVGRERNGGSLPLFMTIGRIGERHNSSKFCAVLRDITHWKKVEADLTEAKRLAEDANAHKTDFLAKISHEIRTPLNAIIGFSQVMAAESFGPIGNERYKQYLKDIQASGEHVISLVNDLLDLSKVASGKLELSFGSVDVNALVAGCVAMIQPQANAGKVIVRSQLASALPPVVADERSIRQIMLNLLSNASKFTEAGGQVVASTSFTEHGEVMIRVRDTGIGMAEGDVKKAMEPFRQIPGPRSTGGTGLGLPLTKALVEANRAAFSIESQPGKGTLVEVVFPSTRVLAE